jgi:hypothetical protein
MNNIVVVGTNTLSGCTSTASQIINVNPAPTIYIYPSKSTVCTGSPVNLTAFGADTYSWSLGGNNNVLTVMPTSNTSYTVLGSNTYGCIGTGVITISTNPLPNVTAFADRQTLCIGESVTLTGGGANTYEWLSSAMFVQTGNPITVSPSVTGNYTVTGTDANGCKSTATVPLGVDACTGLLTNNAQNSLVVYPNPTSGMLAIESGNEASKTIVVADLTGRVVVTFNTTDQKMNVDLSNVANGIYQLSIRSGSSIEVIKVVKQ